jgi:N6-adenosine-specific RNA methylase IME4
MMKIIDIKVGNRFRKDLGQIQTLVKSIQEIGLLQPVVLNQNNELIAGQRRLEAAKILGWDDIPANVVNLDDIEKGELHENAVRKDFTTSERVAILAEIEAKRLGHRLRKDTNLVSFQEENKDKRSVDIVAGYTGVSTGQLQKEKKIVEAAQRDPERFDKLLEKVDNKKTSVDYAFKMVIRSQDHKFSSVLPQGEYDIILADPPWNYDINMSGSADEHYPTMTNQQIESLQVPSAENAILFLWATAPKIKEALDVMKSWGFKYKTHAVWVKQHFGTGYYFRGQHELLLVGEKGDMPVPEEHNRRGSVIQADRTEHSVKPPVVYLLIEQMYPNRKYLELFARSQFSENWTVWGNEI